jgi:phosphopantothenoylcysteine synthetase/decarboxylase
MIFTPASNQALERTADRRENLLSMTSILKPKAKLALVSGRSAFSR